MGEHEAAVVQIGSIAISSGVAVAMLKWLVPYIIQLWFEKKQETVQAERKNVAMAVELEELKKLNAEMQLRHLDEVVKLHSTQMATLGTQLTNLGTSVDGLKGALGATDSQIAKLIPYMPMLERMSKVLDVIDRRAKDKEQTPKTEQVQVGKDAVLVRDKKG